jgi:flagellar hook assembly protein FlgD
MLRSGSAQRAVILALLVFSLSAPRPAAADLGNLRVRPTAFSPNGDGVKDTATIRWDVLNQPAACLLLTIQKGPNRVRFNLGARPVGADSLTWDGKDSLGVVLPDTLYTVLLQEFDTTCAGQPLAGPSVSLLLDTTAPPLPTYDTPDTLVTRPALKIQGDAVAADSVALFLGGVPVDTVQTTGAAPNLRYTFDVVLAEGHNSYSVQSWDRSGNSSAQATARDYVYQNTPDVTASQASPLVFSPNGDGRADSTRFTFNLDAATSRLNVQVRRGEAPSGGGIDATVPVTLLYDGPASAGPQAFTWDGRDSAGTITSDGDYVFVARPDSVAPDGSPIPGVRQFYRKVTLDNSAPTAPYVDPVPGPTTFRTQVELNVWNTLADSLRIFRDGVLLRTAEVEPSLSPHAAVFAVPLHTGQNLIHFQAVDEAGNVSGLSATYTVDYETPLGFHAPEKFRKGDAFGVNLSSSASSVVIDLYTLRGTPVRQLVATGSASHYELPWDLKDFAGVFVGDGPYLARLRVSYPNGTGTEAKAAIVVVK